MKNLAWAVLAKILALPPVRWALIKYAQRTPYFHLEGYMNRWWVFNPHPARSTDGDFKPRPGSFHGATTLALRRAE